MQKLIWTVVVAFIMAIVIGPFVIPWLKKMKFGQTIYELGPKSHLNKQGTPTMGGIIFVAAALLATLLFLKYGSFRVELNRIALVMVCMLGFGLIGFVDDWIKVKKRRSLGLTPKQKLAPQILLSIFVSILAWRDPMIGSGLTIPFTGIVLDLQWAFVPVMVFILVGTVNSANLLDGLDGLLGGCALFDFATMALIVLSLAASESGLDAGYMNVAVFCCAMAGALMGFLRFNSHPAGVIMGDVGSFSIGGALAGVMLVTRLSLLLPIIAFAMLISSLSDIIQMVYFKITHGKRIFRMAPLHHHFELGGMPETKIVAMYYIVTVLLCLLALSAYVS